MDSTSVVSSYLFRAIDADTDYTLVATPCVLKQIRYQSSISTGTENQYLSKMALYDGSVLIGYLFLGKAPGIMASVGNIITFPGLGMRFNTSVVIQSVDVVDPTDRQCLRNITCIYQGPPGTAPAGIPA